MKTTNKTTTKQTLSPGVIQLVELVQLNAIELGQYIVDQAMENPAIDIDSLYTAPGGSAVYEKVEWLRSFRYAPDSGDNGDENDGKNELAVSAPPTVRAVLLQQLSFLNLDTQTKSIARYLIGCVDSRGFLDEDWDEVAGKLNVPAGCVRRCVGILREFSPDGICSRNVRECLISQLDRSDSKAKLVEKVISGYLEELSRGHYSLIARELSVSVREVRDCEARIRRLHPYPAAEFDGSDMNFYITPDICIESLGGRLNVSLPNSYTPHLKISSYCRELRKSSSDPEVIKYVDENLLRAERLFSNIARCEGTLLRCAEKIADFQREFFSSLSAPLLPMTLADIADEADLSVSTVSRALRGKYVQCNRGVIPAKALFSRKLESEKSMCSADKAKLMIKHIIESEDKGDPVSDAQLSEILSGKGISISRRTAAKYREELGFPSSFVRRS